MGFVFAKSVLALYLVWLPIKLGQLTLIDSDCVSDVEGVAVFF